MKKTTILAAVTVLLLTARIEGQTAPNWTSGPFVYDGSSNIARIGDDRYVYDTAGRLVSGTAGQQQYPGAAHRQDYAYDSFGNRLGATTSPIEPCRNSAPCQLDVDVDSRNNRMRAGGAAYGDSGGLLAYDEPLGTSSVHHAYAYDPNGMISLHVDDTHKTQFVYTADDQRIAIYSDQEWQWSIRDLSQKILRDFHSQDAASTPASTQWSNVADHVFMPNGPLGSVSSAGRRHFHLDHLGTARVISDDTGRQSGEHSYYPFGSELPATNEIPEERLKFTGHERDAARLGSQPLDYMHDRYYEAATARFLSPDAIAGRPQNPLSWNRYAYVLNNPLLLTDPTGMYEFNSGCTANDVECAFAAAEALGRFESARTQALASRDPAIVAAAAAYGALGQENGVNVTMTTTANGDGATTATLLGTMNLTRTSGDYFFNISVSIDPNITGDRLLAAVIHEGEHTRNAMSLWNSRHGYEFDSSASLTSYQTEMNAYRLNAALATELGRNLSVGPRGHEYTFTPGMPPDKRDALIRRLLADPALHYGVTPEHPGPTQTGQ
jgi:RHS repeat-associated protein